MQVMVLHYHNVQRIAALPELYELNIGHAIIGRAVFSGLAPAVEEMKRLMRESASLMAIVGIGMDIIEISRIEEIIGRSGERLARRILTDNEWIIYQSHKQPVRFLAKRFAVKEAAAKALGTGIRLGLAFNHFEVANDELGKPTLHFLAVAKRWRKKRE